MSDIAIGNVGNNNLPPPDESANTIDPNTVDPLSLTNPIQFTQDDSDSDSEDEGKPSYQGHGLPAIAMTKIQKVRTLEHNDTDPSGWKQALAYQLIPYALEWLLDSDVPRPSKSHPSFER